MFVDNIRRPRPLSEQAALESSAADVGSTQLVLVEGPSKRSSARTPQLAGRADGNKRCVLPDRPVRVEGDPAGSQGAVPLKPGDYVLARVDSVSTNTFFCTPLARTTLQRGAGLAVPPAAPHGQL